MPQNRPKSATRHKSSRQRELPIALSRRLKTKEEKDDEKLPETLDEFLGLTDSSFSESPSFRDNLSLNSTNLSASADVDASSSERVVTSYKGRARQSKKKNFKHLPTDDENISEITDTRSQSTQISSISGSAFKESVLSETTNLAGKPNWLKTPKDKAQSSLKEDTSQKQVTSKGASSERSTARRIAAHLDTESEMDVSSLVSVNETTFPAEKNIKSNLDLVQEPETVEKEYDDDFIDVGNTTEDDKRRFFENLDHNNPGMDFEALNAVLDEQLKEEELVTEEHDAYSKETIRLTQEETPNYSLAAASIPPEENQSDRNNIELQSHSDKLVDNSSSILNVHEVSTFIDNTADADVHLFLEDNSIAKNSPQRYAIDDILLDFKNEENETTNAPLTVTESVLPNIQHIESIGSNMEEPILTKVPTDHPKLSASKELTSSKSTQNSKHHSQPMDFESIKDHEEWVRTMREQEMLIKGFQLENEKLTEQLKTAKKIAKETEERSNIKLEQMSREILNLKQLRAIQGDPDDMRVAKLQVENERLKEELDKITRDIADKESVHRSEIAKFKSQLSEYEVKLNIDGMELADDNRKLVEYERIIRSLRDEVHFLKSQKAPENPPDTEGGESSTRQVLDEQKAIYEEKIVLMEKELALLQSNYMTTEAKLLEQLEYFKSKNKRDEGSDMNLKAHIQKLESQVADLQSQLVSDSVQLDSSRIHLSPSSLQVAHERNLELEKLLGEYATQLEETHAQRANLESQLMALQRKSAADVSLYETRITELEGKIHHQPKEIELRNELASLKRELEEVKNENRQLTMRLQVSETSKNELHMNTLVLLEKVQKESSKLSISHQEKAIEILREECARFYEKRYEEDIRPLQHRAMEAEKSLAQLQVKHKALKDHLKTVNSGEGCEYCREAISELEKRNRFLEDQIGRLTAEADPDRIQIAGLFTKVEMLEERYAKREARTLEEIHALEMKSKKEADTLRNRFNLIISQKDKIIGQFQSEIQALNNLIADVKRNRVLVCT